MKNNKITSQKLNLNKASLKNLTNVHGGDGAGSGNWLCGAVKDAKLAAHKAITKKMCVSVLFDCTPF